MVSILASKRFAAAWLVVLTFLCTASKSQGTLTNGDFSLGLTGWSTTGSVDVDTQFVYANPQGATISPTAGSQVSELITDGGISRQNVAGFLGVSSGRLNRLVPEKVETGSAMKTTFTTTAPGAVVSFDWNVWTRDYYPPYNDVAFVTLTGPGIANKEEIAILTSLVSLSDFASDQPNANGPANGTGWNYQTSITLPGSGAYTLGFGILHAGPGLSADSYLHIDDVRVTPVPEPSTALAALLALAVALFAPYRRQDYRRRHRPHAPSA